MTPIDCHRGVVHPWMCDAMGHFTTRHYVAMFDDAAYHLFSAIGFSQDHLEAGIGFADVRTTLTYKGELRAGALTLVKGRLVRLGRTSFTAVYEMQEVPTGRLAAEMEAVTVQFDLAARTAIPLAADIRERAEAMLNDGTPSGS